MLRSFLEQSLSGPALEIQTQGPDEAGRAHESAADSQMMMERKVSSQAASHANARRPSLAGSILVNLVNRLIDGLAAFTWRFMDALHQSRQRQANQVIRRYRDLIDDSND